MQVHVEPLTEFMDGRISYFRGMVPPLIDDSKARDWERRGLVRVREQFTRVPDAGKAPAAGTVQLSSASPAAQASPRPTLKLSAIGARKGKTAASS